MPIVNGKIVPWKRKEQLPDGRWQHYCPECNTPHDEERMYRDSFDYKVRCETCRTKEPPRFTARFVSSCE